MIRVLVLSILSVTGACSQPAQVDIFIKRGIVFDGTDSDSIFVNIGITGDKITYIGSDTNISALRTVDATGLWVCPGFIDPHTHVEADLNSPKRNANLPYVMQGVTTVMAGNDGSSPFPVGSKLAMWQKQGIGTNVGLFVGHGTVRRLILGDINIAPTDEQLDSMKNLVDQAMQEGAFGLSSGLFYSPGSYASTEEVTALANVAAKYGGIYDTHVRDESSYSVGLERSILEAIEVGRKSGADVHISHIKALGADVWGLSGRLIRIIEDARTEGVNVTANLYPYNASRTSLVAAIIPRWAEELGRQKMVDIISNAQAGDSLFNAISQNIRRRGGPHALLLSGSIIDSLNNKTLGDVSELWKICAEEAVIRLLAIDVELRVVSFNMKDEDLERFTRQRWVMTASDGTPGHPRKYGTFILRLKEFGINRGLISPSFAIHAASGLTAETLGIKDRGFLREGYAADVIVFDPKKLNTLATYEKPNVLAEGMNYVLVNGVFVIDNGTPTGKLPGKTLLHQR